MTFERFVKQVGMMLLMGACIVVPVALVIGAIALLYRFTFLIPYAVGAAVGIPLLYHWWKEAGEMVDDMQYDKNVVERAAEKDER